MPCQGRRSATKDRMPCPSCRITPPIPLCEPFCGEKKKREMKDPSNNAMGIRKPFPTLRFCDLGRKGKSWRDRRRGLCGERRPWQVPTTFDACESSSDSDSDSVTRRYTRASLSSTPGLAKIRKPAPLHMNDQSSACIRRVITHCTAIIVRQCI